MSTGFSTEATSDLAHTFKAMEIAVSTIDMESVHGVFEIHSLTDCHIDAPDFAEKEFDQRLEEIAANPNAYWVGGGDYWSLIMHNDKRFSGVVREEYQEFLHSYPERCIERALEKLGPIRHKCLALGAGNHEATVGKHFHRNLAAELAARLDIPWVYIGDRGWIITTFRYHKRRLTLKGFQYHGWSAGRLRGRKALQAERDIGAWDADYLFLGHDHQPYHEVFYTERAYNPGGRGAGWRTRQCPRAIINGGSWTYGQKQPTPIPEKKLWQTSGMPAQSWAEGKNFRPQPPVSPVLIVHIDHGGPSSEHGAGRPSSFSFDVRFKTPSF